MQPKDVVQIWVLLRRVLDSAISARSRTFEDLACLPSSQPWIPQESFLPISPNSCCLWPAAGASELAQRQDLAAVGWCMSMCWPSWFWRRSKCAILGLHSKWVSSSKVSNKNEEGWVTLLCKSCTCYAYEEVGQIHFGYQFYKFPSDNTQSMTTLPAAHTFFTSLLTKLKPITPSLWDKWCSFGDILLRNNIWRGSLSEYTIGLQIDKCFKIGEWRGRFEEHVGRISWYVSVEWSTIFA